MSSIQDSAMHIWVNGETITQDKLEQNRKVFETAINDNQSQISAQYTNAQIDAKVNTASSTTKVVQSGTAFPSSGLVDGQEFYRDDLHIMYIYDAALNKWVDRGSIALQGFKNLLDPSKQSFTRASNATRKDLTPVPFNVLRTEQGRFGQGAFIEESTTNLPYNTDFETITGTATVFSDAMTAGTTADPAWTVGNGSFTWSTSGATSGATDSEMTAGNSAWKPLTGSNGTALALTAQATFTEPSTVPTNSLILKLQQDSNNKYQAILNAGTFLLQKYVGGSPTNLASVAQTLAGSSTYTVTLSITPSGGLTAKLYSGVGTGGTLLQPLTATDTSLTGGFLIGVGGDTGVIVKSAQVTAPFADGWSIGGDQRVAWALTSTNPISGSYSVSAVGVSGVSGKLWCGSNMTVLASTYYTLSSYLNTLNLGLNGAYTQIDWKNASQTLLSSLTSPTVTGTQLTSRQVISGQSPSTTAYINLELVVGDAGTAIFDAIQVEQKAYATTYVRNDSTSTSATRNADSLSYTLSNPLPSRYFKALIYKPERSSSNSPAFTVYATTDVTGTSGRLRLVWNTSGYFKLAQSNGTSDTASIQTNTMTFNSGDSIFLALLNDPANNTLGLWIGVNGGAVTYYSSTNPTAFTDSQKIYVGCSNATAQECNGTIDFPILTDIIPTADQVQALYQASDWGGVRHWPTTLTADQPAWIAPTLLSGWVNVSGFSTAGYMKDTLGFIHFKGLISSGTTTGGTTLFYLPVGYRPSSPLLVRGVSSNSGTLAPLTYKIGTDGSVALYSAANGNTWSTLDGITFRAEQ